MTSTAVRLALPSDQRLRRTSIPVAAETADVRLGSRWKSCRFRQLLLVAVAAIAMSSVSIVASDTATTSSAARGSDASTGDEVPSVNEHWLRAPSTAAVASTAIAAELDGDRRLVDVRMDRRHDYVSGDENNEDNVVSGMTSCLHAYCMCDGRRLYAVCRDTWNAVMAAIRQLVA